VFEPHNAPPAAGRGIRRRDLDSGAAWLGTDIDNPDVPQGQPTGRSVVQPPLAPEPVRQGNLDLVFDSVSGDGSSGLDDAVRSVPDPAPDPAPAPEDDPYGDAEDGDVAASSPAGTGPAATVETPTVPIVAAETGVPTATGVARVPAVLKPSAAVVNLPSSVRAATAQPWRATPVESKVAVLESPPPRTRESRTDEGGRSEPSARRRAIAILGAAALAVPAFAIGALQPWQSWQNSRDELGVVGSDREDETATEDDLPAAVPNPNPTPSVAVAPGPAIPGVVPGAVQGGARPPAGSRISPSPAPSTNRNSGAAGLSLTVRADDVRPVRGTSVRFTMSWKDGAGFYAGSTQQWGDGSPVGGSVNARPCRGDAPSGSGNVIVSHTFTKTGTYTVRLSVATYTCDGRTETQTVTMTIVVGEKPTPSPTPSDPASPEPTPPFPE
jgi:hypothetical protein